MRRNEALADRLEHLVGVEPQRFAGAGELVAVDRGIFELDGGNLAVLGNDALRLQPMADGDAVGGGQVLLEAGAFMCSWPRR